MNKSTKFWAEALVLSFAVIFPIIFLFGCVYADSSDPGIADTVYFKPAPNSRASADGDTFYIQDTFHLPPEGEDVQITVNLKSDKYIIQFSTEPLKDKCYGNVFLDPEKNSSSQCFAGGRVPEDWEVQVVHLDLYPPYFAVVGIAITTDPMPPGDGPLVTLTYTALDTGSICPDTSWTPIWAPPYIVDSNSVSYTVELVRRTFNVRTCPYIPGDLNWDQIVDLLDLPLLIYYLFRDWEAPCPLKAADVNCDQEVGLVDVVYLINYIFRSGPPPQTCEY